MRADFHTVNSDYRSGRSCRTAMAVALVLALLPGSARGQTTGKILGRVIDEGSREPVATAEVRIPALRLETLTSEQGNFIMTSVPPGEHRLRVERIGFRPLIVTVAVRADRTTQVTVELIPAPVEVEGIAAEVERVRLIEPDVSVTHEVTLGRELIALPVDAVEEAVELTTGVSDGHFRGGRVGQETYQIDGLEVKNQFESATQGQGLELSPTALEEVDVVTGGFGTDNGSALSGLVSYVTRRGNRERWTGRAALLTDHWAPDDMLRGFSGLSVSAGGPLDFLGEGSTLFADLLAQGMIDADPRARGLTCLEPDDGSQDLADAIDALTGDPATAHLYCPYTAARLPYQRGDKLIGFLRIDRPVGTNTNVTLSLLHNRRQEELYTPSFKYNPVFQLGQRTRGYLATLTVDWSRHVRGRAYHLVARAAAMRLDRYLGVVDPWTFDDRTRIGGFGLGDFRFLGEDFVRRPIEEQLASGGAVPGYQRPAGVTGSPFGPAAQGIFFTEGTPDIANWNTSEFIGADIEGEVLSAKGHAVRAGGSARFYRVENYERVLAYLPGSSPSFARFFPTTANGYGEVQLRAANEITANLGVRVETFRSDLRFQRDRANLSSPVIEPSWKTVVMPRIGVSGPMPGTNERSMVWFNYSRVAQPPDFRFFLDSTIGDSLRTDIRRQGNPNLAFEQGNAFELGARHLLTDELAVTTVIFLKELTNLVTSSLSFTNTAPNQFTTGDFGNVKGLEVALRGRWPSVQARLGYALQEAQGVTSGAFEQVDSAVAEDRIEFPLAFDRRHTFDASLFFGRAAGQSDQRWSASLTGAVRSGFPVDRRAAAGAEPEARVPEARLPWTALVDLRVGYELGGLGLCGSCRWRVLLDGRNILNRNNIIALRRDTGEIAPDTQTLDAAALALSDSFEPIPFESPLYSVNADLNRDGIITLSEFETARFAAALDASDPSLFFGEDLQVRAGVELSF